MSCDYCGSQVHVWWDCPKKPAGWKPGRLRPAPKSAVERPAIDIAAQVAKVAAMTPDQVAEAHKKNKAAQRAAKRGHSSKVEREPSKLGVAGSSPAGRSNPSTKPSKGNAATAKATKAPKRAKVKRPKLAGREMEVGVAGGVGAPAAAPHRANPPVDRRATDTTSLASAEGDQTGTQSKRRGRPRTIGDMKAYKAQKERERRARLKGASNAKT